MDLKSFVKAAIEGCSEGTVDSGTKGRLKIKVNVDAKCKPTTDAYAVAKLEIKVGG